MTFCIWEDFKISKRDEVDQPNGTRGARLSYIDLSSVFRRLNGVLSKH